jgi:cell shape-determining protein MreC
MIKIAAILGITSSVGIVLSQLAPMVPGLEKMASWPVTAMLSVITLSALSILYYVVRQVFKTIAKYAELAGKNYEAQRETNTRLNELCQKIGEFMREGDK